MTMPARGARESGRTLAALCICLAGATAPAAGLFAQTAPPSLVTRWAHDVRPGRVLPEYPRPQMARASWQSLNGFWDYALTAKDASQPAAWDGRILVPFPIESQLSGVRRAAGDSARLWYHRTFRAPRLQRGGRLLLHFGAVDWEATVFVNGRQLGVHRGGYDPFTFDVTDAVRPGTTQDLVVGVWDPTDRGPQPRGKQVRKPEGIWYTAVTGIWQTVWLEAVPQEYVSGLVITPDVDAGAVEVRVAVAGGREGTRVHVTALDGAMPVAAADAPAESVVTLAIPHPRLWSPRDPFLYGVRVRVAGGDAVRSYFGMRKIAVARDSAGVNRLFLNDRPLFEFGTLDQGWWPDGLYTAPTEDARRFDLLTLRRLGFNLIRKHVKVEPERWYYWCDKLGLLVWQDMPSGDKYIHSSAPDITRTPESAAEFETELQALIQGRGNHPCIVMWVPYNEGWGQWDTPRVAGLIKELDPTRLVDNASGWTDRGVGDVMDMHKYPGPGAPEPEANRAIVLGEFGGLGLPVSGHTWQSQKNWGYRSFANAETLTSAYIDLVARLFPLIDEKGLSAAVYTQTTDVEIEVNGLMTYDRALVKMDLNKAAAANRGHFPPRPRVTEVVPTALTERVTWRFTLDKPAADWFQPGFDARAWKESQAGFGTRGTPGAVVRTEWKTDDIWLRREFAIQAGQADNLRLLMHHDEDAEVYLNGVLAASAPGFTTDYEQFEINPAARAALKPAGNVLAVHCHQTAGGQYIDVGIVKIEALGK